MARRGKGWYGEKQRHREAALKGFKPTKIYTFELSGKALGHHSSIDPAQRLYYMADQIAIDEPDVAERLGDAGDYIMEGNMEMANDVLRDILAGRALSPQARRMIWTTIDAMGV